MTGADMLFARKHAHDYADGTSYWLFAADYARWYVDRFCDQDAEMEDLPAHPSVFQDWVEQEGTAMLGAAMAENR